MAFSKKKQAFYLFSCFAICLLAVGCGSDQKPGAAGAGGSDGEVPYPQVTGTANLSGNFNFASIVRSASQGAARTAPWAGSWWPYSENGTAFAAKDYDRARSNSSQGAQSWELSHHGASLPGIQDWWGHCNGWAAAAVLAREPRSSKSVGGVVFSTADQKALLSEIGMEVTADYFGNRAEARDGTTGAAFQDVWPDQFFLVMTQYLGQGLPVVIDRYTGVQVWNQPIAGYQISPVRPEDHLGPSPDAPNVDRINVTMQVWWARDDVSADHVSEPFSFNDNASYESRVYRFELWLDSPAEFSPNGELLRSGNVILTRQGRSVLGGIWKMEGFDLRNSHPDYIWVPHSFAQATGFANPRLDQNWILSNFN